MFFRTGEYNHQLDAKNRIRIPPKLKDKNGEKFYFSRGTNNCLFVWPDETVTEKLEQLKSIPISDEERRRGVRSFTKSLLPVDEDTQGRIVIPSPLKLYAKIEKDIVICGSVNHIEIWAKEVYDEYFGDDDENFDVYFNELGI